MILGELTLDKQMGALHTARDSHTLKELTTVSVRQPFLAPALIFSAGIGAMGWSFEDVLYAHERICILIFVTLSPIAGWMIARMKLRSRELRSGDVLSDAVWGSFPELNKKRREVIRAAAQARAGAPS